jgi:hypothetical protein
MLFTIGDCLAGMLIGVATALVVRALVWPGMDMVIAMLIGMAVGMVLHFVIGLSLSALLGMFETMMAGVADRDVRRHVVRDARFDGGRVGYARCRRAGRRRVRRNRRAWCEDL